MSAASAPEARWICEAQQPGKKSHEFETAGPDAAHAYCDVMGWELLRVYQEGSDSDRPLGTRNKPSRPLSQRQVIALAAEAQQTHRFLIRAGIDVPVFDDWRHSVVSQAIGKPSFKDITNAQFMKVRNAFRELRGAAPLGSSYDAKRQTREAGDTLETRSRAMHMLAQSLGTHARVVSNPATPDEELASAHAQKKGGAIGIPYMIALATAKNRGQQIKDIDDLVKLPTSRLEQLFYTLRNRIAAREGRGDKDKRNKSQRDK